MHTAGTTDRNINLTVSIVGETDTDAINIFREAGHPFERQALHVHNGHLAGGAHVFHRSCFRETFEQEIITADVVHFTEAVTAGLFADVKVIALIELLASLGDFQSAYKVVVRRLSGKYINVTFIISSSLSITNASLCSIRSSDTFVINDRRHIEVIIGKCNCSLVTI